MSAPKISPYLTELRQKAREDFARHSAQHGRDWGHDGEWAFNRESEVRKALAAADPTIAKQLALHPQAVMSSYSPTGRAAKWVEPDWHTVLVFTEHGIGDPYEYAHVHQAFDKATKTLDKLDPDMEWSWDSINPAVHTFRVEAIWDAYARSKGRANPRNPARRSQRHRMARRNPATPETREAAVAKYEQFHRYKPEKITEFAKGFAIPDEMIVGGTAKYTTYRSGKVDPSTLKKPSRPVDYIHEHDAGVRVYLAIDHDFEDELFDDVETSEIDLIDVPDQIRQVEALVKLGESLGFAFKMGGDLVEYEGSRPLPELYCTPDGACLLIIQDRRDVVAMIWGGGLGVFARGIDG